MDDSFSTRLKQIKQWAVAAFFMCKNGIPIGIQLVIIGFLC
jgi:hypothetical protein